MFGARALDRQLAVAPFDTWMVLCRQRLLRLGLTDELIDLDAVQRPPDTQDDGQHHHEITIGQQQIVHSNIAVRMQFSVKQTPAFPLLTQQRSATIGVHTQFEQLTAQSGSLLIWSVQVANFLP
ncbi:hypothetical protein ABIF63_001373 [Bradyrhizobium japonicum]|uniref:Uncharacterized protein n=1 Tax=Bradyrhizobium japonicum TaxID=375 RepID=A0ABV2RLY0_BRAJP